MAEAGRAQFGPLIKKFKADKVKNANVIVDFLQYLESSDLKNLKSGMNGLQIIFSHLLREGDIKTPSELPDDLMRASEKFNNWLYERYNEVHEKLRSLLKHEGSAVPEMALSAIARLLQVEGLHPIVKKGVGGTRFPNNRLQALINDLVSQETDHQTCIKKLRDYMECQDFMYFTLLSLSSIVKKYKGEKVTEMYINNLLLILEQMNITEIKDDMIICTKLFLDKSEGKADSEEARTLQASRLPYTKAKKATNTIWNEFITYPLTPDIYRRCLILIPDKVIHHLDKPLRLTGFFMDAYDLGGAISLLALQGVFILVNKYNLDYPNFYPKLYGLLEPTVFHAKYRPRFFMLMERFLASSHLPEYIVAAFIKKLSRLSLVAPASCLVLILKFIANLLIRYPGLQKLIHKPDADVFDEDPFDPDEADLSKCRACDSSLWEVSTLKQHVIPSISKATGFLEKTLPTIEYDISELVETTYEEIHEKSCKLKVHDTVPTTFHKPQGLFAHHDDKMSEVWSVM
ncbi:Nucleolar complex protein 4 [Halocaridina rubra]|uniref:Nucleolar complex protein 4 n=1 Tax=Halocaridina rubra TaxID=373956 RepID=A0AAN9A114_HALRR